MNAVIANKAVIMTFLYPNRSAAHPLMMSPKKSPFLQKIETGDVKVGDAMKIRTEI